MGRTRPTRWERTRPLCPPSAPRGCDGRGPTRAIHRAAGRARSQNGPTRRKRSRRVLVLCCTWSRCAWSALWLALPRRGGARASRCVAAVEFDVVDAPRAEGGGVGDFVPRRAWVATARLPARVRVDAQPQPARVNVGREARPARTGHAERSGQPRRAQGPDRGTLLPRIAGDTYDPNVLGRRAPSTRSLTRRRSRAGSARRWARGRRWSAYRPPSNRRRARQCIPPPRNRLARARRPRSGTAARRCSPRGGWHRRGRRRCARRTGTSPTTSSPSAACA